MVGTLRFTVCLLCWSFCRSQPNPSFASKLPKMDTYSPTPSRCELEALRRSIGDLDDSDFDSDFDSVDDSDSDTSDSYDEDSEDYGDSDPADDDFDQVDAFADIEDGDVDTDADGSDGGGDADGDDAHGAGGANRTDDAVGIDGADKAIHVQTVGNLDKFSDSTSTVGETVIFLKHSDHPPKSNEPIHVAISQPETSKESSEFCEPIFLSAREFEPVNERIVDHPIVSSSTSPVDPASRSDSFFSNQPPVAELALLNAVIPAKSRTVSLRMSSDPVASLGTLVHDRICSFLEGIELARSQIVSRSWYQAGSSVGLWGSLLDTLPPELPSDQVTTTLCFLLCGVSF